MSDKLATSIWNSKKSKKRFFISIKPICKHSETEIHL